MTPNFVTPRGVEVPAVSADQMREIDRIAIEETGPNLFQMMENAGRSLALELLGHLGPERAGRPVLVLAGTGGNGGGGICAARHLTNKGLDVIVIISDEGRLDEVPRQQLEVFREAGSSPGVTGDLDRLEPSLIVDALVGYSLDGPVRGRVRELISWANASGAPILSLDVPSGVDSTTGDASGEHVRASWTLTLALPKSGLAVDAVGELALADIGIPAGTYRRAGVEVPARLFADSYVISLRPVINPDVASVAPGSRI